MREGLPGLRRFKKDDVPRRCQEQGLKSRLHKTQVWSIHIIPYYILRLNQSYRKYQYIYLISISLKDVYTIYEYSGIEKFAKKMVIKSLGDN